MPAHTVAECFVALVLVITGLSHIVCPRLWIALFKDLFTRPYAGLWIGMLTLMVGAPIAIMHNRWEWGAPLIATVIGWAWTVKGTLYLLVPGLPMKVAARHLERPSHFVGAGVLLAALGVMLAAGIYGQPAAKSLLNWS